MSDFIKVGVGWRAKSGNGYSCQITTTIEAGSRILVFKNKQKKEDKHPDIILGYFEDYESKQRERDQRRNEPAQNDITLDPDSIPF